MPEIAEVARIVDFIRTHLVGRTLSAVRAQHDENVFGKVGTSAAEIEKHLTGKKIIGAGQQGKYFWMSMSSPPHPLCHFGMAGWFHIRDVPTAYYKPKDNVKAGKDAKESGEEEWPPKYWKFVLTSDPEDGKEKVEAALVDFRRFGRVRLIDCAADEIRKLSPLKENGPDPVVDRDLVTEEWLANLCNAKRVPIKAVLLDQANISGIGNWVGDEVLYHAEIHPEQYAHTLNSEQLKRLHHSILHITKTACDVLGDSDKFPEEWLFKHRWGKGKKDATNKLPNGEKIVFMTVGGRTSAVVPSVQKKTGPVAGDVKEEGETKTKAKPKEARRKRKKQDSEDEEEEEEEEEEESKDTEEVDAQEEEETFKPSRRGRKSNPRLPPTATKEETNALLATNKKSITKRVAEKAGAVKSRATKRFRGSKEEAEDDLNVDDDEEDTNVIPGEKLREKPAANSSKKRKVIAEPKKEAVDTTGRRRSGRLSGRG